MESRFSSNCNYGTVVVGAGHAGVEAALVSARRGVSTLLVTTNLDRISFMSCNPAIGGLAKGHMVRELDAMGGEMGRAADESCIQFKRLNTKKGPAVRGSRAQCDKALYSAHMTEVVLGQENLTVRGFEVKSLLLEGSVCCGVILDDGSEIRSQTVIVTTGTFMRGVMHVGNEQTSGGRFGDRATVGLSDQLRAFGFEVRRLKTGTPPRLDRDSIDFSLTEAHSGDTNFYPFSFRSRDAYRLPQVQCFLSYTNEKTHDIIRANLDKSPMYCGAIEGVGPRYCPSVEDKVVRFADKTRHQTFLEPEGLTTNSIYLQGISTSLPADVQDQFIRTIRGLEKVRFLKHGYAIEYDFIEPTQIFHSLETRGIRGLFLAGQINGTSGYEEAAAQGFIAGVNSSEMVLGHDSFVLGRHESYIGVLIDDLVTKGTREPYRMFTSRAEHRLVLREDNTLDRILAYGLRLGLISLEVYEKMQDKKQARAKLSKALDEHILFPRAETFSVLDSISTARIVNPTSLSVLLRRPEVEISHVSAFGFDLPSDPQILEPVEIEIKYSGYIGRQLDLIEQTQRLDGYLIPEEVEYASVRGLSREEIEKLNKVRPRTVGQANRISGVNPSAIQALLIHIKGRKKINQLLV